ncbi:MAG: OmpH family outer membrane protein [Elusimicrobia bacterium]|nr:OmpH family outer membrane protein [Elusimicrobiota bacterium]
MVKGRAFRKTVILTAIVSAWAAVAARALEVSLEENKAQRGSIGYVDMQKLFRLYPETQKAKQNFEEVLRQAEEQVNLRKAELIGLRADVIRLRLERDAAAKLANGILPAPAPKDPGATTPAAAHPAPAVSTGPAAGAGASISTRTAVQTSSATAAAPASSTMTAVQTSSAAAPGVQASSATVSASAAAPQAASSEEKKPIPLANLPGLGPDAFAASPDAAKAVQTLNELESKLAEKSRVLQDKEAEFKTYQAQVEKNLIELEDKRTEILLGKIYHAVQEVAREEGVSVVVDRSQILFGQQAMDLTEKVLKKLKS